jgi:hypothetical protein
MRVKSHDLRLLSTNNPSALGAEGRPRADGSEEAFNKVLKRVAKAPPPKSVQKRKRKKDR